MAVVKMFGPVLGEDEREAVLEMMETLQEHLDRGELQSLAVCALVEGDRVYSGGVWHVSRPLSPHRAAGGAEGGRFGVVGG